MVVRLERYPVSRPYFEDLPGFDRSFDSLFNEFFAPLAVPSKEFAPVVDIAEYPSETVVLAELPGVQKENISISFDKGTLTISGERKPAAIPEGSTKVRNERQRGLFSRSVTLEEEINAEGISAELSNGVLKVTLPKAEKAKAREITIR